MANDVASILASAAQEMQVKYIYFILTATGACIGFTVTQTQDLQITWNAAPLGLAVLSWACSFYSGCLGLQAKPMELAMNFNAVMAGRVKQASQDPELIETLVGRFDSYSNKFQCCLRWQFRLFVVASFFFLLWHALEIWSRQPPIA